MRYIERILQPGEVVLHSSRLHWIVYLPAGVLLSVTFLTLAQALGADGQAWVLVSLGCFLGGIVAFISAWLKRWTTEIDVTDRRIYTSAA